MSKRDINLIFTVGLQCSGKTTWAKSVCEKDSSHFRVSLDDLRLMRGKYWIGSDEKIIHSTACMIAANAISFGKTMIFDAMNLTQESRDKTTEEIQGWLKLMTYTTEVRSTVKDFTDIDIRNLFHRCNKRILDKDPRGITNEIIFDTWKRNCHSLPEIHTQKEGLNKAVIFDIDGTIAKMNNRSPFDWGRVGEDTPVEDVMDLVRMFAHQNFEVIFMSGRSESCREETRKWLTSNLAALGSESLLFMRKAGDSRRDDVVKLELFLNKVAPYYDVKYVFDDRNQVVDMWRNMLGLRCLQVAEGNF